MEDAVTIKEGTFSVHAPVGAMSEIASARQAQEVQAMVVVAKKFPRNQKDALDKMIVACGRLELAVKAIYSYPRGNEELEGHTIRLVEEMARCWGNMVFGVHELERREGSSLAESFCWDLEANVRDSKVFEVPHERYSKKGGVQKLTESRDIYEMIANYGARRKRACILSMIPKDIQDACLDECKATLKARIEVTAERIQSLLTQFETLKVTKEMIEARLQRPLNLQISPAVFFQLGGIFNSIQDGMTGVDDWFEPLSAKNDIGEVKSKSEAQKAQTEPPPFSDPAQPKPNGKTKANGEPDKRTFKERFEMVQKSIPASKWDLWINRHYDPYLSDLSLTPIELREQHYKDLLTLANNFMVGGGK